MEVGLFLVKLELFFCPAHKLESCIDHHQRDITPRTRPRIPKRNKQWFRLVLPQKAQDTATTLKCVQNNLAQSVEGAVPGMSFRVAHVQACLAVVNVKK
jgi:hypothetical protein